MAPKRVNTNPPTKAFLFVICHPPASPVKATQARFAFYDDAEERVRRSAGLFNVGLYARIMAGAAGRGSKAALLLLLTLTLVLSSLSANAQIEKKIWQDGEQEWNIPQKHRLFFSGTEQNNANLSDIHPFNTNAGGSHLLEGSILPQIIFDSIESQPVQEAVNLTLNMSAYIHATATDSFGLNCAATARQTQMFLDIQVGQDLHQLESNSQFITETSIINAHNFTFPRTEIDMKLNPGDKIVATLRVMHDCQVDAKLWWAGVAEDGGLVFEGQWMNPDVRIISDDLGFTHVDMVALGPWALQGYRSTVMEVWGPMEPDDSKPVDRESILQIIDNPQEIRKVEENRTSWTYITPKLDEGHWILQFCMKTNDQPYTAQIGECHFKGWVHIVNDEKGADGWQPVLILAPLGIGIVLLWLGLGLKQGILYPPPLIGIMLLMSLLFIPMNMQMPYLSTEAEPIEQGWPAPQFVLNAAGNNSSAVSLDELLDGKEAALIAISIAGSPNQKQHIDVLDMVMDKMEDRVSLAMLVTGEEVQPFELEELQERVNARWPIMIDEHDAATAKMLPTGMADGLVLIDSTGHIAWWSVGSSSLENVENAIDDISFGSSQSPQLLLSMIWTAVFPLVIIALPRKEWEKPEDPLPPGGNWGGIAVTGGIGFMILGLPLMVLAMTGLAGETWYLIQFFVGFWLLYQAVATALWGIAPELKIISKILHKAAPETYRKWKEEEELSIEIQIGMWVAWFSWILHPMLIPQGLSNTLLTGGFGLIMGILLFVAFFICSGAVVLVIRLVAGMGGKLSVMFGKFARDDMVKIFGALMIPIALWYTAVLFFKAQGMGFFI